MSLLDITPDFDITELAWRRPLQIGSLGAVDAYNICEILKQESIYIPDGIQFIEKDCFPRTLIGRINTVSIPAGCTVSPYVFNGASVKQIICRGPIKTDPIDSFLAFLPSLEEATVRISDWPVEDSPVDHMQLPLIEGCENLRILRLGGMPRFPDSIIRDCRNLKVLFVDDDVEEVSLRIFHGCINVKEIIPDNPKTTIPSWFSIDGTYHSLIPKTSGAYKLLGRSGDL